MKLTKNDILKLLQGVAEEHGFKMTLQECDEMLKVFEETYAKAGEQLEPKQSCNVGCVKVEKKEVKPRNGKSELNGNKIEWSKPGLIKISLKSKASFVKEHEIEV